MQAGMDVARLNVDYFDNERLTEVIRNIQAASDELQTSCPIFIDLKGYLVRTITENKPIELQAG